MGGGWEGEEVGGEGELVGQRWNRCKRVNPYRGNDGKTTSNSGLALNGISCYRKLKTVRSGGSWL